MGIALVVWLKSKDPYSKNGAIIVDEHKRILSTGFNWFVSGIDESKLSWWKDKEDYWNSKYPYVLHAEENAILHCSRLYLNWCVMYCKKFPCNECAKKIAQKKIKKVVYYELKNPNKPTYIASKKIFKLSGVEYEKYNWNLDIENVANAFNLKVDNL